MLISKSSRFYLILYSILALSIYWGYARAISPAENMEWQECRVLASTLTVHDFRKCFRNLEGERVSVVGIVKPLYNNEKVVNIDLVPNRDFAEFPQSYLQRFSVLMTGEIDDDGESRIDEGCFGNFAIVTGTAGVFGGMPAIKDIAIVVGFEDGEAINCLETPMNDP